MAAKQPIFKDDVLNALEDEPLHFDSYAKLRDSNDYFGTRSPNKLLKNENCQVCAVGAILRQKKPNMRIEKAIRLGDQLTAGAAIADPLDQYERPKNWMSALSMFWESLCRDGKGSSVAPELTEEDIEECREITIDWVEENFPDDEVLAYV